MVSVCAIRAAPPELSPTVYTQTLERLSSAVRLVVAQPGTARTLAAELPPAWSVSWGGQEVHVSTAWLKSQLEAIAAKPDEARKRTEWLEVRLGLMRAAAAVAPPDDGGSLASARARLQQVLAQQQFRNSRRTDWIGRLKAQVDAVIARFFRRVFSGLVGHPKLPNILAWTIGALLVLLMMALLIRLLARPLKQGGLGLSAPSALPLTWQDSVRVAIEAAARGDFRSAVRSAYDASVRRLEERGLWQARPDLTPREYVRLLPPPLAERPAFAVVAGEFESVLYGARPATDEGFRLMVEQLEMLGCSFH